MTEALGLALPWWGWTFLAIGAEGGAILIEQY